MMALSHYIRTSFGLSGQLNVSYRIPESAGLSDFGVWLGMFFLCGLIFSVVFFRARNRLLFFGIALFLAFWLPHSGVLPLVTFAADRFMYLPMLGVACVVAAALARFPRLNVSALVVLVVLFCLAVHRTADWRDDKTLWAASVKGRQQKLVCVGFLWRDVGKRGR